MIKKISLSLLSIMALTNSSLNASDLKPMIQLGYDFGGTTLATVEEYDSYNGYQTSRIRAGEGLDLELGASISDAKSSLELQFFIGYKVDQKSTYDGSVTWDRTPFTSIAMFKKNNWKFGGGATYHVNPKLSGSFSGYDNGVYYTDSVYDRYKNAIGGVIEIQYQVSENSAIGLKGTLIEYELESDHNVKANGNSIGLHFSYTFGERSEFR